jgi:hypothetical protein
MSTPDVRCRLALFVVLVASCGAPDEATESLDQAPDELAAAPAATTSSKVEMLVSGVDDYVYVTVDGVRRKVSKIGGTEARTDVSSWFAKGNNAMRIQGINTGGPADRAVQTWVDSQLVSSELCPASECNPSTDRDVGILFDNTVSLQIPNRPTPQTVNVTSSNSGKVYVNGVYTGRSTPTSLTLPQGSYVLGLGVSQDTPPTYTGRYYERNVTVASSAVSVNMTQSAPLGFQSHTRIAILPIRQTIQDAANVGILTQSDIDTAVLQADATRRAYVEPFSYGLVTWDVTLLSVVENTPIHRNPDSGSAPDGDQLLIDAGLTSLKQSYDIVVFLYSMHKADGSTVDPTPCCAWAWKQSIAYSSGFTRGADTGPNVFLFHESLHNYEFFNSDQLSLYNGIDGLHGANWHGYQFGGNGEVDFVAWYRAYTRGQVSELDGMRPNVVWPQIPNTVDLFVGIFDTIRKGIHWPNTAVAVAAASLKAAAAPGTTSAAPLCALPRPR